MTGVDRTRRLFEPQDIVWVVLFGAMMALSPEPSPAELVFLPLLAAVQILEPKLTILATPRGVVGVVLLKLLLAYLLVGFTGAVNSSYYFIFLLPVVSAATAFGPAGAIAFSLAAGMTYLSFLLYIDWSRYTIAPPEVRLLCLRLTFIALVGYLTHRLAQRSRAEERRYLTAVNQLQEAEAAVRRSERLVALGQLTAGLAHELRNPLGTIRASAEMLSKNLPPDNELAREMAGFISSEVDRTSSLITRFLEFARPTPLRLQPADLSEVLDGAIAQFRRTHSNTAVHTNYSPEIRPFLMDREILERVVYNLLVNAAEASPPGGVVTVKTRLASDEAEISVIDRGTGIDPKHTESIFNPFFTTKPAGVGLGLALVSKFVDEHGGKIAVESEPGRGSVFIVRLPLPAA